MNSTLLFIKKWFQSPIKMGSLFPSSGRLMNAVVRMLIESVDDVYNQKILFVGAGTGVLFKAFRKYNINPDNITSVELDEEMCLHTSQEFSEFNVINADIRALSEILKVKFSVVISALPLTLMHDRDNVISKMIEFMNKNGVLIQYSYRIGSPIDILKHNLKIIKTKRIYFNIPTANILVYSRSTTIS